MQHVKAEYGSAIVVSFIPQKTDEEKVITVFHFYFYNRPLWLTPPVQQAAVAKMHHKNFRA
jgi:hypothetical protein